MRRRERGTRGMFDVVCSSVMLSNLGRDTTAAAQTSCHPTCRQDGLTHKQGQSTMEKGTAYGLAGSELHSAYSKHIYPVVLTFSRYRRHVREVLQQAGAAVIALTGSCTVYHLCKTLAWTTYQLPPLSYGTCSQLLALSSHYCLVVSCSTSSYTLRSQDHHYDTT